MNKQQQQQAKQGLAVTVDSLVNFTNKKKKFSFSNRKINSEEANDDDDDDINIKKNDQVDDENVTVQRHHKGSAMLKHESDDGETTSASSDGDKCSTHKKKTNHHKKKKKKSHGGDDNEDDEDEKNLSPSKKQAKRLAKVIEMFSDRDINEVKRAWNRAKFDAKKAIDLLLKEKENKNRLISSSSSSECESKSKEILDDIDEWSDGDPEIRARNEAKKLKYQAEKEAANNLKRKKVESPQNLVNGEEADENKIKEPSKKRLKKFIVDSEDDDENETKHVHQTNSSSATTNTSSSDLSQKSSTAASNGADKKKGKKAYVKLSSDSDDDDEKKSKKHQHKKKKDAKHKKNKKEKKKRQQVMSDEDYGNEVEDGDGNFDKSDADAGSTDSNEDGDNLSDGQKVAILSLFSEASVEEIMSMINITKKKIETLLALRPFATFKDLQTKLTESKLSRVIDVAKDVIYARSIVNTLLTKCEQISQKMENQVARLINSSSNDDESGKKKQQHHQLELKAQPSNLNESLSLKPYQLIGLNWLCLMHKENINGILADEMGLGKTCQTIAFLAHLFEHSPKLMHLIVVPPSTLDNWVREISTWCPEFNFTVYQGSLDERRQLRSDILNDRFVKPLNAILTSYGMLSSSNEDKAFFRKLKLEYCIYDEAHMLKNMNSIRYQSLIKINSRRRLLLTGTPLQNNLVELMSLLYFVMPDIFEHKTEHLKRIFETKPADVDKDTFYSEKIAQAKGIMRPFIMRRLKTDVLKQLPQKVIKVLECEQTTRQAAEYEKLISVYRERKESDAKRVEETKTNKADKKRKVGGLNGVPSILDECNELKNLNIKNSGNDDENSKIGHILMELRKAANHPLLRRCLYDDAKLKKMAKLVMSESSPDTVYEYVLEDMSVMSDFQLHKLCSLYRCLKGHQLADADILDSGKFVVLDRLLTEKIGAGSRVLIFSQFVIMLDILEEFLKIKAYKYCRLDGTTAVSERQDLIDEYNDKESEIFVFLLSTKAGGMGINLTAANVVIMHDIDYNPFNDKQAEDRCHRVGQTKTVEVFKLIAKDSIDEAMLSIQTRKLELDSDIADKDKEQAAAKVDMVSMLNEALRIKIKK